ncbi:MAG: hypothetical protein H0U18_08310 [Pyrinomonadaceae bacterium]|jgi:hypothetical protein|nr:hypothetical protein [Pyrinomonadaceae bacterium]
MFEADKEEGSDFTRKLSGFMVVGSRHLRDMPQEESDYVIATLFKGINGVQVFDKNAGSGWKPSGIAGFRVVTNPFAAISIEGFVSRGSLISE